MPNWRRVKAFPKAALHGIVSPRRGTFSAVPGLDYPNTLSAMREMLGYIGLDGYNSCVTGEMRSRPGPQMVKTPSTADEIKAVYRQVMPEIYRRTGLNLPIQTFNNVSRMGHPYFARSDTKKEYSVHEFERALDSDGASLQGAFTTSNIRLQPEPASKERDFQFMTSTGDYQDVKIGEKQRLISVKWARQKFLSMRTRLVFNLPCVNLILQILDTMFNNAIGSQPVCAQNMYSTGNVSRIRRYYVAFDVKHMERNTAIIIPERNKLIGGRYGQFHDIMAEQGYIVPQDDWRQYWLVQGCPAGWLVQFGSGHSAVAPSQKELVLALLVLGHIQLWGYTMEQAVIEVLSGESKYLSMMNYGDDNFLSSHEPRYLDQMLEFLAKYIPVEVDPEHTFLGFSFNGAERRFMLRPSSYVLKTYMNERPPSGNFRKAPNLGWVLKRQAYLEYGDRRFFERLFDHENDVLAKNGLSWQTVLDAAEEERKGIFPEKKSVAQMLVFGKEYLLTQEERLESGGYDGIGPVETGKLLMKICDEHFSRTFLMSRERMSTPTRQEVSTQTQVDKVIAKAKYVKERQRSRSDQESE